MVCGWQIKRPFIRPGGFAEVGDKASAIISVGNGILDIAEGSGSVLYPCTPAYIECEE
jgi:hypothetical protein